MAGDGRSPSLKSDSYYGGGSSSGCGTPRHHWRSASWTARSRERDSADSSTSSSLSVSSAMASGPSSSSRPGGQQQSTRRGELESDGGGSDLSKQTQLLCPPLSSLSVSRRADGAENRGLAGGASGAGGEEKEKERKLSKKPGRGRNGLEMKLDLGALRQGVNFHENDAAEPTDTELSQKREKMALCEKQCSRIRPHLYFGSSIVAQDFDTLRRNKITHIVNCVGYVCSEYFPDIFHYRVLWLQDSHSEDIFSILYDCFDYFEDVKDQGGRVYVHCCQGVSRSAAIVIAYLMWREGRTYDDVFENVKSLRAVTSPNIGFVIQLMNWQSRILGSPRTPSLRMFRMAPHSPYDPLHQVPKSVSNPSMSSLDSRGAFVIQFANRLYVWQGRLCDKCMLAAADKVAFQLIRYEHAQSPILTAREGSEPPELYDALMKSRLYATEDGGCGASANICGEGSSTAGSENPGSPLPAAARVVVEVGQGSTSGCPSPRPLLNPAYDTDFEAYNKARSGEVLASLPDSTNLRGWDGRWNTPRHDFCCGILSRNKR